MRNIKGKQTFLTVIFLLLVLIGCNQNNPQTAPAPKLITQTPPELRNIPISDLSVRVSIDGVTKTYLGTDSPDGQWQIEFDLQPNQTYDIVVQWFLSTHLLLEEAGQIFTDPDVSTISPELEFISAGQDRFDDDCDGFSNLDEVIRGTSLTTPADPTQSLCMNANDVAVLAGNVFPWILRQHSPFQSEGITSRVTTFEQPVQVTATNPNYTTNFGVSLKTERDLESEPNPHRGMPAGVGTG